MKVSISLADARRIMAKPISPCQCACNADAEELRAAANTVISQQQAILCDQARIAELEEELAESKRQERLAIAMVAAALKIEVG